MCRNNAQVAVDLEQPSLIIKRKGRPANNPNKEEGRRVRSFLEDLKAVNASQLCLSEQTVGAAAVKNPGGKGVPKRPPTCLKCGEVGHKAPQCPGPRGTDLDSASSHTAAADAEGDCDAKGTAEGNAAEVSSSVDVGELARVSADAELVGEGPEALAATGASAVEAPEDPMKQVCGPDDAADVLQQMLDSRQAQDAAKEQMKKKVALERR